MPKNTSTVLAIAPAETLSKAVEPKPTKREIIEAMTQIEHPRLVAEWEASVLAHSKEEIALKGLVAKHVRAHVKTLSDTKIHLGYTRDASGFKPGGELYGVDANFNNIVLPPELQRRVVAYHAVKIHPFKPEIYATRKRIQAKMSGYTDPDRRVAKLLADPESKKVLDEMLAALPK